MVITYLLTFINVVVIGCLQPVNWDSCAAIDKWLPPYIDDYKTFKTVPPYSNEKYGVQIREEYERLQRDLYANKDRTKLVPGVLQK